MIRPPTPLSVPVISRDTMNTVPDPAHWPLSGRTKSFPLQFRAAHEVLTYPVGSERIWGDTLEIGPGRGDFLLAQAAAFPDQRWVAIEVSRKRYHKLIERVERRRLTNVQLASGDARLVIPRMVDDISLNRIVIMFPDPWPKRRHAFHRLLTVEFVRELARCLKFDGELFFRTDVGWYAEWVAENVAQVAELRPIVSDPDGDVPTSTPSTLYEEKSRSVGAVIHTRRWRRI